MSYFPTLSQNIILNPNNTSVVNIVTGGYFIGTASNTLGVAGIQVSLKTSQNCTVWVDQAPTDQLVDCPVGTSAATNDTTTLTGTNTFFTKNFSVGDTIVFDPLGTNQTRVVASIVSDTVMTVTVAFTGGALSSKPFKLYPWDITDNYNYYANNDFGITIQAVAAYVRVRVYNYSGINTSYFRLTTVLWPIVEAVPRSLDHNGHLRVHSYGNTDGYGFDAENTPTGDQRTIVPVKLVGVAFEGPTLDTNFWTTTIIAGATITQTNGRIDMLTNTTANAIVQLYSSRKARRSAGCANVFRMAGRFGDTGTANNVRQFGAVLASNYTLTITSASVVEGDIYTDISGVQYTILITATTTTATVFATGVPTAGARTYTRVAGTGPATLAGTAFTVNAQTTDGFFFQLSGTTFSVVTAIGGDVSTGKVDSGAFNGDIGTTYLPDTNMHTWEIYYNSTTVWFTIDGVLLHTISNLQTPLSNTLSLNAFVRNGNFSGGTTNAAMYLRSLTIKQLGPLESERIFKYIATNTTTICKRGGGRLYKVIFGNPESAQIVTLYDGLSTSAPIIATLTNVASGSQHGKVPTSIEFNCPFHNGLTMVTSTTEPITIIYE